MAYPYFKSLLNVDNCRPSYFVPFRNLHPLHSVCEGCFAQILRLVESSGRSCQGDESSHSDRPSDLPDGILEQVRGERTLQSQWRSQWLLLGNGTLLCNCKPSGSNVFLFPRNRNCAVLGWCRIPRGSPFRSKWGAQQRITPFCKAALGGFAWGLLQPRWMDLLWLNALRGSGGSSAFLSLWKRAFRFGECVSNLSGKGHQETYLITGPTLLAEMVLPPLQRCGWLFLIL